MTSAVFDFKSIARVLRREPEPPEIECLNCEDTGYTQYCTG